MSQSFGRRKQPHTVIIANGDHVRHFQVRPWFAALVGAIILSASLGYLGATAYLVFRDDLINASLMRQARIQHAYEDRISALRSQVDRITSHRLLDQQFVESKIAELASRQDLLAKRTGAIAPLLERASGLRDGATTMPVRSDMAP
ncbi:MAG: M23 family peptidase, partial [Pseudomonadota bacterium]